MTETQKTNPFFRSMQICALIAAGLLGNYFKFPIFLNIDFIFGSIFAMLALQFFGRGTGIAAAAVISGYTYFLWHHPYAIIIMTAEAAVVAWLMNRYRIGMVLADTIYWIVLGMPLVYLFYHVTMHIPFNSTSIVMIKQAVNGITNALTARLIFTCFAIYFRSTWISYKEIIYNLMAFFVLCPVLFLLAIGSRTDFAEVDHQVRTTLIQDSQIAHHYLENWVLIRESIINNLAAMAATNSPEQMQSYLELIKKSDDNFLRIGLLDKEATIIAYFPVVDDLGQKNIGKNFADRPFIPILKQTLKPLLSEVVMGRIGIPKPMTTMLSPVVVQGQYNGYVTGILCLDQIRDYLEKSTTENAVLYSLIDKNGNVIMTNRTDQQVMVQFVRNQGSLVQLDSQISQWVPVVPAHSSIMERWKQSFYITESAIGSLAEWKLVLELPVAPFQKKLYKNYTDKLTLLFLILTVAMALAELLSRKSITTLENLRLLTQDLPGRLSMPNIKEIAWPESSILEANHLITNFQEMADSLANQFHEIRKTQDALNQAYSDVELQVRNRTAELDATNQALTTEITERKQTETALRESEEKYRVLFENELYAICIFDVETFQFIDVNDAYLRLYGYGKDELLHDISVHNITAQHHETDNATRQVISDGTGYVPLRFHKKKDGTVFPVEIVGKRYEWKGRKVMFALAHDISERWQAEEALRENEARMRAITDSAQDAIIMMDSNGLISFWNSAAERILGYMKEEAIGRHLHNFIAPSHYREEYDASYPTFQQTGLGVAVGKTLDLEARRKDATQIFVQLSLSAVHMRDGWHAIGILRDITDRKQAEEDLKALNRELQSATDRANLLAAQAHMANAAKSEFLANMSHEIRTPMNGVIGMTGLLLDTKLNDEQRRYAEIVHNSAESLLGIINDILDFSKIEAKKLDLETLDFNLSALMNDFTATLAVQACQKGLEILCCVDPDVPTRLRGDPGRLRQILTNLAANAVKFTHHGNISIHIKLIENNKDDVLLHFGVLDTGIGIPENKKDIIFANFTQADASTTRRYGGTGLGLAISKQLAELMGGEMGVESQVEKGSEFWFTVRLSKQPDSEQMESIQPADFHSNQLRSSRTILPEQGRRPTIS